MKNIIVYGSEYGTTKAYAAKFSEISGIPLVNSEEIKSVLDYDTVIHFGGLYAGGVKGLKKTIKSIGNNARLIVVTVGLADVNDKNNTDSIKKSVKNRFRKQFLRIQKYFTCEAVLITANSTSNTVQ